LQSNSRIIKEWALGDTGATGRFIDNDFVNKNQFPQYHLKEPQTIFNMDGTLNQKGLILDYVKLLITVGGRSNWETFYVTGLGKQKIILGLPWFQDHNPDIDWRNRTISWRKPIKEQESRIKPKKKKSRSKS
jgi:Retroviral aspartyl protease